MNLTKGVHIAIYNLLIVASIGSFLRYLMLHPVPGVNYGYILHAHSHMALLGWVFMVLYVLIVNSFAPSEMQKSGKFAAIFILLQVANIGMLVTFPIMGYALWSIVFSALHALLAMIFVWILLRHVKQQNLVNHSASFIWIKWALFLMIISNLAPFALGPVSATQGKSDLYYLLIYFYLHFQYNGWFTFALIGLFLRFLETKGVQTDVRLVWMGFKLKLIAVFPAFILSALWVDHDPIWNVLGGLSALMQLVGLILVHYFVVKNKSALGLNKSYIHQILFWIGLFAITFQHLLMLLSAVPDLADIAFARNIVVAYLHLVLIGFVSVGLFLLLLKNNMVQLTNISKIGFLLFLGAFVFTELVLIFLVLLSNSTQILFYLALVQLLGVFCIAFKTKSIKLSV